MKITIAYVTGRREPRFDWFVESLITQYPDGEVTDEIVFVDGFLEYELDRREKLANIVRGRFTYLHTPPKPSIWRGKHRKSKRNFYDVSGAKNTACVVMTTDHIVIMDDLSYLMPGWLDYHRAAAIKGWIFSGQFVKAEQLRFEGSKLVSWSVKYPDCRLRYHEDKTQPLPSGGGWVFGSSTGLPLQAMIETNGWDEFLARAGGEDCDHGVRLENAGWRHRMFYDSRCWYVEDDNAHSTGVNEVDELYPWRKFRSHEETKENHHEFVAIRRWLDDETHPRLYQQKLAMTRDQHFNLVAERDLYRLTGGFKSVDHIDWFDPDGTNIRDL